MFAWIGYVELEKGDSSLLETIWNLGNTVFTWWEQTLVKALNLFVGFFGLVPAYIVIHIGVKTLLM